MRISKDRKCRQRGDHKNSKITITKHNEKKKKKHTLGETLMPQYQINWWEPPAHASAGSLAWGMILFPTSCVRQPHDLLVYLLRGGAVKYYYGTPSSEQ